MDQTQRSVPWFVIVVALAGLALAGLSETVRAQSTTEKAPEEESANIFADFDLSAESGTLPLIIEFTDTSTGTSSWRWDFGDGSTSEQQHPLHIYVRSGRFVVELEACDGEDCSLAFATIEIEGRDILDGGLLRPPSTVYGAINEPGDEDVWVFIAGEGDTVTVSLVPVAGSFLDGVLRIFATNGALIAFDDDSGFGADPLIESALIPATGVYKIETGGIFDATGPYALTVEVIGRDAVRAAFEANPAVGVAPLSVSFHNSSSNATGYLWNFGDGSIGTETNPQHTYDAPGSYTITLTACREGECAEESASVIVEANDGGAVESGEVAIGRMDFEADVDFWTFESPAGSEVTIDLVALGSELDLLVFLIDEEGVDLIFDDDSGNGFNPRIEAFPLLSRGTYTIEVAAFSAPQPADYELHILVDEEPVIRARVEVDALGFTAPATVLFQDTSRGGPTSQEWDFGDGSTGNGPFPEHVYEEAGAYVVTLETCNAHSCDTWTVQLRIVAEVDGGTLEIDQTVFGAIDGPGDIDDWILTGEAGQTVDIAVIADDLTFFDPVLEILAPDGTLLAFDDDSGDNLQPRASAVELPVDGDYVIRVRGFSSIIDFGAYQIDVSTSK
jgi:PKD repeat protein